MSAFASSQDIARLPCPLPLCHDKLAIDQRDEDWWLWLRIEGYNNIMVHLASSHLCELLRLGLSWGC